MIYAEKLLDVRWQRKRLEKLSAVGWKCENCCAYSKTLHVHHTHYRPGAEPWEYSSNELEALCNTCHAEEHRIGSASDTDLADGGKPFYAVIYQGHIVKNFARRKDAESAVTAREKYGKAEYIVVGQA